MKKYTIRPHSSLIQKAILAIFFEMKPRLTVRQIYYALTVRGIVQKDDPGYRQTCYQLKRMRENNLIPHGWIADNTRFHIKPDTDSSLEAALERWQKTFRRDLWVHQKVYVEIWVEKDALAGVIQPITDKYDVPLFVTRGYSSITFIYEAAEDIKSVGKPAYIYHFGDFDPSGVDAAHKIEQGLRQHGADIHFERVAITQEQIKTLHLPVRATKASDPRSKTWGNRPSVELDALPATILRKLVQDCIERHIDRQILESTWLQERLERQTLKAVRENMVLGQNSTIGSGM
jgi:hypothetical protein